MWQPAILNILTALGAAISSGAKVSVHVEIETGRGKKVSLLDLETKNGRVLATEDGEVLGEVVAPKGKA